MKFQYLTKLLEQDESIFTPRKLEDRKVRYEQVIHQQIQDYIKKGAVGNLRLERLPLKSLPDNLKYVGGCLFLEYTSIESLPEGLKVRNTLDLGNTPIKSLPEGLTVGNDLYLENSKITSLPPNLKVRGELFVFNTPLKSAPPDLKVGMMLDISNTPLAERYSIQQLKQMLPHVKSIRT